MKNIDGDKEIESHHRQTLYNNNCRRKPLMNAKISYQIFEEKIDICIILRYFSVVSTLLITKWKIVILCGETQQTPLLPRNQSEHQ